MSGRKILSLQNELVANNKKWLKQSISGPLGTIIVNYATLVSADIYIMVSITYSPNNNVSSRQLLDIATQKTRAIEQSFDLQYTENNAVKEIVGGAWLTHSNDDVMDMHRNAVQKLLYGPDAEKTLLQQEQKLKENKVKDDAELRKSLKHGPL
jgi:hypothetical protein